MDKLEYRRQQKRNWEINNREKRRLQYNAWYAKNKRTRWSVMSPIEAKNRANFLKSLWRKKHPEVDRMHCRKRRAKKLAVNEHYTIVDECFTKSLFNNICVNCGSTENLTVDHHYPLILGHALTRTNAVLLCRRCNSSKGDKLPEDFYTKEKLQEINNKLTSSTSS